MKRYHVTSAAVGLAAAAWGAAVSVWADERAPAPSSNVEAAQVARGKVLFISNGCGWCHEGGGRNAGKCPQLMNSPRDDTFIINRIVGGSAGRMPAFGQQFTDTDIRDIIAYIRSLQPES